MGQTIAEKILSAHAGKAVTPGELVISNIDVVMVQDGTGPLAVNEFKKLNKTKLHNPKRTILFIDHAAPSPRKELSNSHMVLRDFANEYGAAGINLGKLQELHPDMDNDIVLPKSYRNPKEILKFVLKSYSYVTALIFALCLPAGTSFYVVVLGALFATIIGKYVFGGFGNNIFTLNLSDVFFIITNFSSPKKVTDSHISLKSDILLLSSMYKFTPNTRLVYTAFIFST